MHKIKYTALQKKPYWETFGKYIRETNLWYSYVFLYEGIKYQDLATSWRTNAFPPIEEFAYCDLNIYLVSVASALLNASLMGDLNTFCSCASQRWVLMLSPVNSSSGVSLNVGAIITSTPHMCSPDFFLIQSFQRSHVNLEICAHWEAKERENQQDSQSANLRSPSYVVLATTLNRISKTGRRKGSALQGCSANGKVCWNHFHN